jgi:hypothetical protein
MHGRDEKYINSLGWKTSGGKRPLGRSRHRWKDNIRMNLTEIGWEGVDWTYVAYDRDQCRLL